MFNTRAILAGLLATVSFSDAFQPIATGLGRNTNVMSSSRLHMSTEAAKKMPGTAKLDTPWEDLGFQIRPTNSHVKLTWKEGEGWSKPELVEVRICINQDKMSPFNSSRFAVAVTPRSSSGSFVKGKIMPFHWRFDCLTGSLTNAMFCICFVFDFTTTSNS